MPALMDRLDYTAHPPSPLGTPARGEGGGEYVTVDTVQIKYTVYTLN